MRFFSLLVVLAALAAPARAAGDELDAVHHTSDGYYLDFSPFGKVEMPRLFVVRRNGALAFDAFGSSTAAVASGRYAVDASGAHGAPSAAEAPAQGAENAHGGEPEADAMAAATAEQLHGETATETHDAAPAPYDAPLVPVGAEMVVDLSITRHLVFAWLAIGLLLALFLPLAGKYRRGVGRTSAPRGALHNMLETLVVYVRDEIAKPNIGAKHERFLPYLLTVFLFILTCNLLGLVPFGATATANITTTAVLALITFVITQFAGTKDYWLHILWPPGVPAFVKPILIPIEIMGLFTKPFALAVRLFANMTAGHLVILNLLGLIFIIAGGFGPVAGWGTSVPAVLLTVAVYALEVLVAFIQAYVFTVLSALFIGMATAEHEHHHDPSQDHDVTHRDVALHQSAPLVNGSAPHKEHGRTVGTEAAMA